MDSPLFAKYSLENWQAQLQALARPCLRGYPTAQDSPCHCGGLPRVDEAFVWPRKDDLPLQFVAQIACSAVPQWNLRDGFLLFFYSDRHWGSSPDDRGHARVLWQAGQRQLLPQEQPVGEASRFFGLLKKPVPPRSYTRVDLDFRPSWSYPSLERLGFEFPDDFVEEAYGEFLAELTSPIQIGGFPDPIQGDTMERDCQVCTGIPRDDWVLLMQMQEVGDQTWGDAGALYWFVPSNDLQEGRFNRVWCVSQCH